MTKAGYFVLAMLAACVESSAPGEVTIAWTLDADVTVGEHCRRILVGALLENGEFMEQELACDAISTDLAFDDTPTTIDIRYRYTMIPFGCESDACWREESFASGSAQYTSGRTDVIVHKLIVNPF